MAELSSEYPIENRRCTCRKTVSVLSIPVVSGGLNMTGYVSSCDCCYRYPGNVVFSYIPGSARVEDVEGARSFIASYDNTENSILRLLRERFPDHQLDLRPVLASRRSDSEESLLILDGVETTIKGKDKGIAFFTRQGILSKVLDGISEEIRQELKSRSRS
jgi:hypothetical protein